MLGKIAAFFAAKKILLINIAIAVAAVMFTSSFISLAALTADEIKRSQEFENRLETVLGDGNDQRLKDIEDKLDELLQNQGDQAIEASLTAIKGQIAALDSALGSQVGKLNTDLTNVQKVLGLQIKETEDSFTTVQEMLAQQLTDVSNAMNEALVQARADLLAELQTELAIEEISNYIAQLEYFKGLNENIDDIEGFLNEKYEMIKGLIEAEGGDSTAISDFIEELKYFKGLSGNIADIQSFLDEAEALMKNLIDGEYDVEVSDFIAKLEYFNALNLKVNTIDKNVATITGYAEYLKALIEAEGDGSTAISDFIANLEYFTTMEGKVDGIISDVAAIKAITDLVTQDVIDGLLERVDVFDNMAEQVDAIEGRFATLQANIYQKFEDLTADLNSRQETLTKFIEETAGPAFYALANDVTSLLNTVNQADKDARALINYVEPVFDKLKAAFAEDGEIAQIKKLANDAIEEFGALKNRIGALEAAVTGEDGLSDQIGALGRAFAQAQSDITTLIETTLPGEVAKITGEIGKLDTEIRKIQTALITVDDIESLLNSADLQINKDLSYIKNVLGLLETDITEQNQAVKDAQAWIKPMIDSAVAEFYATIDDDDNEESWDVASVIGYDYDAWFKGAASATGIDLVGVSSLEVLRLNLGRVINLETENLSKKVKDLIWDKTTQSWLDALTAKYNELGEGNYFGSQLKDVYDELTKYIKGLKWSDGIDGTYVSSYCKDKLGSIKTFDEIMNGIAVAIETLIVGDDGYYATSIKDSNNPSDTADSLSYDYETWFNDLFNVDKNTNIDEILVNIFEPANAQTTDENIIGGKYDKTKLAAPAKLKIYVVASDSWLELIDEEVERIKGTGAYDAGEIDELYADILGKIGAVRGINADGTLKANKDMTLDELADLLATSGGSGIASIAALSYVDQNADVSERTVTAANGTAIGALARDGYKDLERNSDATQALIDGLVLEFYIEVDDNNDEQNRENPTYIKYTYGNYFQNSYVEESSKKYGYAYADLSSDELDTNAKYEAAFAEIYAGGGLLDGVKAHIYGAVKHAWKITLSYELKVLKSLMVYNESLDDESETKFSELIEYIDDLTFDDLYKEDGSVEYDLTGTAVMTYCKEALGEVPFSGVSVALSEMEKALKAFYDLWIHDEGAKDKLSDGFAGYDFKKWFMGDSDGFEAFVDLTFEEKEYVTTAADRAAFIEKLLTVWDGHEFTPALKGYVLDQTKLAWAETLKAFYDQFKEEGEFPGAPYKVDFADYYDDTFDAMYLDILAFFDELEYGEKPANFDQKLGYIANKYALEQFRGSIGNTKEALQQQAKERILEFIETYYMGNNKNYLGLHDSSTDADDNYEEYLWLGDDAFTGVDVYGEMGVYGYAGSYWFAEIIAAENYKGFVAAYEKVIIENPPIYNDNGDVVLISKIPALTDDVKQKVLDRVYSQWMRYFNEAKEAMMGESKEFAEIPVDASGNFTTDETEIKGVKKYWKDDETILAAIKAIEAEFARIKDIKTAGKKGNTADSAREFYTAILSGEDFTDVDKNITIRLIIKQERLDGVKDLLEDALKAYYKTIDDDNDSANQKLEYWGYDYDTWFKDAEGIKVDEATSFADYVSKLSAFVDGDGNLIDSEKERVYKEVQKKWLVSLEEGYEAIKADYYKGDINGAYAEAKNYIEDADFETNAITGTQARTNAEELLKVLIKKVDVKKTIDDKIAALKEGKDYYNVDLTTFEGTVTSAYEADEETTKANDILSFYGAELAKLKSISEIKRIYEDLNETDYYAVDWAKFVAAVANEENKTGAEVYKDVTTLYNNRVSKPSIIELLKGNQIEDYYEMDGENLAEKINNRGDKYTGAEVYAAVEELLLTVKTVEEVESLIATYLARGYADDVKADAESQINAAKDGWKTSKQAIEEIEEIFANLKTEFEKEIDEKIDTIQNTGRKADVETWTNQILAAIGDKQYDPAAQEIIRRFMDEAHEATFDLYVTNPKSEYIYLALYDLEGYLRVPTEGYLAKAIADINALS